MEPLVGIEPTYDTYKVSVLPLNDRGLVPSRGIEPLLSSLRGRRLIHSTKTACCAYQDSNLNFLTYFSSGVPSDETFHRRALRFYVTGCGGLVPLPYMHLVGLTGVEPASSCLKGKSPKPLDDIPIGTVGRIRTGEILLGKQAQ